jgi:hypothetical protein
LSNVPPLQRLQHKLPDPGTSVLVSLVEPSRPGLILTAVHLNSVCSYGEVRGPTLSTTGHPAAIAPTKGERLRFQG